MKEADGGVGVAQLTQKQGSSPAAYYHWKLKYAGSGVPELKRLCELGAANAKLNRMYADRAPKNTAIKDVLRPGCAGGVSSRTRTLKHLLADLTLGRHRQALLTPN